MTAEERTKANLIKRIGRGLESGWRWQGTQFTNTAWCGVRRDYSAVVFFTADHRWVKARIETEELYSIPDSVRMFSGDNCIADMVEWVADKLIELDKILCERTAPYVKGHEDFNKALRGIRT